MKLTLRLPWPPNANHIWKHRIVEPRGKKRFISIYLSSEAKIFRKAVRRMIERRFPGIEPSWARLRVAIIAVPPDRRVRDLSNLLKATEDALTHAGLWGDDSQIRKQSQEWAVDELGRDVIASPGWIELTVERLGPEPDQQRELIPDA